MKLRSPMSGLVSRLAQARVRNVIGIAALMTLVPLWTLATVSVQITQANAEREVLSRARTTAAVSAVQIQSEMSGLAQLVESFASRTRLQSDIDQIGDPGADVARHLEELRSSRPGIANTMLVDDRGIVLAIRPDTPRLIGESRAFRDWYQGVKLTEDTYTSGAFETDTEGKPTVITVATPVRRLQADGTRVIVGYLAASYGLEQTQLFSQEVARAQGINVRVVDQNGALIADGDGLSPDLSDESDNDLIAQALRGETGTAIVERDGEELLSAYAPVPDLGWAVVSELPERETLGRLDVLRNTVLILTGALSLALLGGLALLNRLLRQQRSNERQLQQSAEETSAILEAAQDAFISLDDTGSVVRWSHQAEMLFGWTSEEAVGSRLRTTIIPPELRDAHERGIAHYLKTGDGPVLKQRIELEALHKDGHRFPVELVVWPVKNSDGQVFFSSFLHDITERRAAAQELASATEQAEEASRLKSEFLANMSHEIRTPMNGVIGMGTLLLQTPLDPEQRDYVETIRRSADALLTIINDILDFSKIEAGRLELEIIDFNVRLVAEEAADLLSKEAHNKGLELVLLMQPNVPQMVAGDPGRLRQIILNLLSNAVKFTESGEVVVACRVESRDNDDVMLRFEVTDTGPGIPAVVQNSLFESFNQADASTTRRHGGTGLGLAISKQLAELMGGTIGVESVPGRGSTFWFNACFAKRPDRNPVKRSDLAHIEGMRVAVVDDNETNRKVLDQQLKAWKMRPTLFALPGLAMDAIERAVRVSGESPFDIALLDYNMPEMDGLELASRLKNLPGLEGLPIVLLTSSAQRGEIEKAERVGIGAYLTKPVRQSALYDCLVLVTAANLDEPDRNIITAASLPSPRAEAIGHLLVVEDNPVNQKVAVRSLEKMGYRADVAANGREAVEAVKSVPYAAVLMDCQMPEMDGYEATEVIRSLKGPERLVPIIAMTAAAMDGDEERCRAAGMDEYITKPVQWAELQSVLSHYLEHDPPEAGHQSPASTEPDLRLDPAVVTDLKELGIGHGAALAHLQAMVREFLSHSDERLTAAQRALNHQNFVEVAAVSHMLRGSMGAYGAKRAIALSGQLEQAALSRDVAQATVTLTALKQEFELVKAEVIDAFLRSESE